MYVLDESKLGKKEKAELIELYQEIKNIQFPSILEQLRTEFAPRIKIDIAFAKKAKWQQYSTIEGLRPLYAELLVKLEELQQMMSRDK